MKDETKNKIDEAVKTKSMDKMNDAIDAILKEACEGSDAAPNADREANALWECVNEKDPIKRYMEVAKMMGLKGAMIAQGAEDVIKQGNAKDMNGEDALGRFSLALMIAEIAWIKAVEKKRDEVKNGTKKPVDEQADWADKLRAFKSELGVET